jgi:hypothetical protein
MPTRIVTTHYRYKRLPLRKKADALIDALDFANTKTHWYTGHRRLKDEPGDDRLFGPAKVHDLDDALRRRLVLHAPVVVDLDLTARPGKEEETSLMEPCLRRNSGIGLKRQGGPRPVELPRRSRLLHHRTGGPALSRAPDQQHGARCLGGRLASPQQLRQPSDVGGDVAGLVGHHLVRLFGLCVQSMSCRAPLHKI